MRERAEGKAYPQLVSWDGNAKHAWGPRLLTAKIFMGRVAFSFIYSSMCGVNGIEMVAVSNFNTHGGKRPLLL